MYCTCHNHIKILQAIKNNYNELSKFTRCQRFTRQPTSEKRYMYVCHTTRQYLMKNVLIKTRKKIDVGVLTFCKILIIAYFLHISYLSLTKFKMFYKFYKLYYKIIIKILRNIENQTLLCLLIITSCMYFIAFYQRSCDYAANVSAIIRAIFKA